MLLEQKADGYGVYGLGRPGQTKITGTTNYRAREREEREGQISRRATAPQGDRKVSETGSLDHSTGL